MLLLMLNQQCQSTEGTVTVTVLAPTKELVTHYVDISVLKASFSVILYVHFVAMLRLK